MTNSAENNELTIGTKPVSFFEEKVVGNPKTVYDGKVVHLTVETVELPAGGQAGREIVRHQGAVALLCTTKDDRVVLVRQWRAPLGEVSLEVPAGKIEPGEDPSVTAKRELNEEVRFESSHLELMNTFYTSPGFADEKMYLYRAKDVHRVAVELPQDADERLERVELTKAQARAALAANQLSDAKTVIAIQAWLLAD